jgi:integrase
MRKPERLPSGRWKVRFRLNKQETSETFDSERAARRFAKVLDAVGPQAAIDELYEGIRGDGTPTLSQVAGDHIEHLTSVTDGTRLKYTRIWDKVWAPLIGGLRADKVTKDAISRAVITLSGTYSAKSMKNQRGLLFGVLNRAVEEGYLPTNPAKGVRLPRAKEHQKQDMRILTADELNQILEAIHPHYRPFVMFLAGTGCRWGEVVALEIRDVVLPNVRIRQALQWSPDNNREVGPTKTGRSNRTIVLPPQLVDDVKPLLARTPGDLVFTAPRGGMIQHRTFWSDIWQPAVKGLPLPRPRIHDLRHSHAAWLLAEGVPIHIVQARLGHESITTTVDTYGGLLPDAQMQAAAAAALVFKGHASVEDTADTYGPKELEP